jgi:hypothetical protein
LRSRTSRAFTALMMAFISCEAFFGKTFFSYLKDLARSALRLQIISQSTSLHL